LAKVTRSSAFLVRSEGEANGAKFVHVVHFVILAATMSAELRYFDCADRRCAYRCRTGRAPTIVFLPGYASDMEGTKALALDTFAEQRGLSMLRFDYSGTGSSSGHFEDGTLALWLEEALAAVDRLTSGPLVLVGSSMGGWIALHLALLRPGRVRALVGVAAAPDFTDWGFTDEQKATLERDGRIEEANPYGPEPSIFTHAFWASGQRLRLLGGEIAIDCPVRLLHGEADEEVPLDVGFRLMRSVRSSDVQLNVLKGGGHRLSEPHEIRAILSTVEALLEPTI
jgi:pimeloyl-ACP methyl ester carboxylesterase